MRTIEQGILDIFKHATQDVGAEIIAKALYPEEFKKLEKHLESIDKTTIKRATAKRFQLHRKILYYLNKLESQHIIKMTRIEEKGEKLFGLAIDEGEIILEKGYKKIIITKTALSNSTTEKYEQELIMKKFAQESFISSLNTILLECSFATGIHKFKSIIKECMNQVNDTIALNEFEHIIRLAAENNELEIFIDEMNVETLDRNIILSLNITTYEHQKEILQFIQLFAAKHPKNINIVFNLTTKELNKHATLFEECITLFSEEKIKINIKNNDIKHAPYIKGRAGMYTFDDATWNEYCTQYRSKTIGVSCAQSAIAININRFFENYHTDAEFRKAVLSAAKMLLSAHTLQRRKLNEYFRTINLLNGVHAGAFYRFQDNYIRFWNYDWQKHVEEKEVLFDLLKSTKEVIDQFCYSEETIFKSCGIPIRFRIAFSSAFRNFDSKFMGEREYKKAQIRSIEDFYKGELKGFIYTREKMFEIFDGGDRLRIFRSAEFNTKDIIHEWNHILSSYKIPFFTYDFSGMQGMTKLTNYL